LPLREFGLAELANPVNLDVLRNVFFDPDDAMMELRSNAAVPQTPFIWGIPTRPHTRLLWGCGLPGPDTSHKML
jgi:hypothetical protein